MVSLSFLLRENEAIGGYDLHTTDSPSFSSATGQRASNEGADDEECDDEEKEEGKLREVDDDDEEERVRSASSSRNSGKGMGWAEMQRSEEHTSELQSLMRISYAVFCLKKKIIYETQKIT